MTNQLYDRKGKRKYINRTERNNFLIATEKISPELRCLCLIMCYTGCRISEALALTPDSIDHTDKVVIFESLKKRSRGIYRAVPIPEYLLAELSKITHKKTSSKRIWPCCRCTAWRKIKSVMHKAGITNTLTASPRSLRHGFGVAAVSAGIPLNLVQRWLGHAKISTTAIYANATGDEERNMAAKMWCSRPLA